MRYYFVVAIYWCTLVRTQTKGDQSHYPSFSILSSPLFVYEVEGLQPTGLVEAYAYAKALFY